LAGLGECIKGADRSHQFHAVVGGRRLAARQFLRLAVEAQDGAPASGAGIARAGAVGENLDPLHRASIPYSLADEICRWKRSLRIYSSGSRFITSGLSATVSQS